eukprot:c53576_g1_i1 orf=269-709(-)
MPGARGRIALRLSQCVTAVVSLGVMISAKDFSSITAFCFLVAAMVLQCMWSLSAVATEGYAWLLSRRLQDSPLLSLFAIGDWITAVVSFASACASTAITVLLVRDTSDGCAINYCGKFAVAAVMAFLNWMLISASFLSTFWVLATR